MTSYEGLNFGQDRMWCHGTELLRAIARTSMLNEGSCTELRAASRAAIYIAMDDATLIDLDKLRADMAAATERVSPRRFSLAATGGKNPDFYRNFVNNGRDRRMSAEVFIGIVQALGKSADEYVRGAKRQPEIPNATALTSTFAYLLESIGVEPFEGERAQRLARQFPDALQRSLALQEHVSADQGSLPGEASPAGDPDQPLA